LAQVLYLAKVLYLHLAQVLILATYPLLLAPAQVQREVGQEEVEPVLVVAVQAEATALAVAMAVVLVASQAVLLVASQVRAFLELSVQVKEKVSVLELGPRKVHSPVFQLAF
jgi:hypothetical protein